MEPEQNGDCGVNGQYVHMAKKEPVKSQGFYGFDFIRGSEERT